MTRQKPVDASGRLRRCCGRPDQGDAPVRPSGSPRWALITFWVCFVGLLILLSQAAFGHDEFRCSQDSYRSATGMDCCSARSDCAPVSTATAWEARLGSQIEITRDGVTRTAIVNAIHPSCDDHGRSWACTTGCIFRTTGF